MSNIPAFSLSFSSSVTERLNLTFLTWFWQFISKCDFFCVNNYYKFSFEAIVKHYSSCSCVYVRSKRWTPFVRHFPSPDVTQTHRQPPIHACRSKCIKSTAREKKNTKKKTSFLLRLPSRSLHTLGNCKFTYNVVVWWPEIPRLTSGGDNDHRRPTEEATRGLVLLPNISSLK